MRKTSKPFSDTVISAKPRNHSNSHQRRDIQAGMNSLGHEEGLSTRPANEKSPLTLTISQERQLMLRLEELARIEGLRDYKPRKKIPSATQILIDSKADDLEVLKRNGSVVLSGPFVFRELSADPEDPDEGHAVIWMSDGTDSGDDGDIMVKIAAGETTKTAKLLDFSAI